MDIQDVKVGMEVVIIDPSLNAGGPSDVPAGPASQRTPFGKPARVLIVQETPGKLVGLCLKEAFEDGHSLDGACPKGHGWWTRPEYIYTPAEHAAHAGATAEWREQRDRAMQLAREFIDG